MRNLLQKTANKVVAFKVGALIFVSWGVFCAIGALFGFLILNIRFVETGLSEQTFIASTIGVAISSVLGAKLFWIIENYKTFFDKPLWALRQNRFNFFGGFILSFFLLIVVAWKTESSLLLILDNFALAVPIAVFFGRIGCFTHGCCHGKKTTSSCGVKVTNPLSVVIRIGNFSIGDRIFPTQLIAAAGNLLLFITFNVLLHYEKLPLGMTSALFIALYSLMRFFLDFTRGEHYVKKNKYITIHQLIALILLLSSTVACIYLSFNPESYFTLAGLEDWNTIKSVFLQKMNFLLIFSTTILVFFFFSINYKKIGSI